MSSRTRTAPDGDRRVGHVERPEVGVAPVDVDEVDDVAGDGAVDQVAERAAEDQREPEARQPLVEPELRRVGGNRDERDGGDADHHQRLVGKVGGVQQAERRAGVVHVGEVEEARE